MISDQSLLLSTIVFNDIDSSSCDSVEIILPMDMDNIGIGCYELGIIKLIL